MKLARPRVMEPNRSDGCEKSVVEAWFATWDGIRAAHPILPSLLANFDETMIQPQRNSTVKVVAFNNGTTPVVIAEPELPHITLGVTIFADGTHTDHLLIYPSKFVPQELRGDNAAIYGEY